MIHIHMIEFILHILGIVYFRKNIIHDDNRESPPPFPIPKVHPLGGKQE